MKRLQKTFLVRIPTAQLKCDNNLCSFKKKYICELLQELLSKEFVSYKAALYLEESKSMQRIKILFDRFII